VGPLEVLLSFIIGIAANGITSAVLVERERRLKEVLADEEKLRRALASRHSLRDEVGRSCVELARNRSTFNVSKDEAPLWRLLLDPVFQNDLTEWLMTGGIKEGDASKDRLVRSMTDSLGKNVTPDQIKFLATDYFQAIENMVFCNPALAHWRHQLSLDYLREQVALIQETAEEAVGVYSKEKQMQALGGYCEKALKSWDIIDLSNLPEGDIDIATQRLMLRQLYVPLRIIVEPKEYDRYDSASVKRFEEVRQKKRLWEAGRLVGDESALTFTGTVRSSVGERLGAARRLVILGDPGGGKTTLLRWMATVYLLRFQQDPSYNLLRHPNVAAKTVDSGANPMPRFGRRGSL